MPALPLSLTIPLPPRTNALWRRAKGGGMIINPDCADEYAAAIAAVRQVAAQAGQLTCGVEVSMVFYNERRATDVDARVKAALDSLTKGGLLVDDVQVCRTREERRLASAGQGRVEVVITECANPDLLDAWDSKVARAARMGPGALRIAQEGWASAVLRQRALKAIQVAARTKRPAAAGRKMGLRSARSARV